MTPGDDLRISQLLGCDVVVGGTPAGVVTDVRLAQVGVLRGASAELVVESLLVSRRHTGSLFGYDRRGDQGPLLLRFLVRRLHRNAFLVDWVDVADWDRTGRRVHLPADVPRRDAHTP